VFLIDRLIFVAAVLLILGIVSSKLSSRVGLPVLVLFLLVGMLAGSEGLGGIEFENYQLTHAVGTLALAVILFDGGLRTNVATARAVLAPSVALATIGVLVTAAITAAAARALIGLTWTEALLLGSIVGSTDAAAVFAVLRSAGLRVRERVAATLELESGSNDPMAVILTIVCIELILGRIEPGPAVVWLFVKQLLLGAIIGWACGRATSWFLNRVNLDATGLYPVLVGASSLLAFGTAAIAGGSGFLSVYVAGIVIGAQRIPLRASVYVFHDGAAWLSQIAMFVILGLLSFPSRLAAAAVPSLLLSAVLILVARPVAVAMCLLAFRFSLKEIAFISSGGLKGAVPIILATYPLMWNVPGADSLFNVVFFVVLVSAVTQGWMLPYFAKLFSVRETPTPTPPVMLEISSLRNVDGDIVEYTVTPDARASGHRVRDFALPDGALVAMVVRGRDLIPPRGSTTVHAGDHVFVLLRPSLRPIVDHVFGRGELAPVVIPASEFPLRGSSRVVDIEQFYGVQIDAGNLQTLDEFMRAHLGGGLAVGRSVTMGPVILTVREIVDGRVATVGLGIQTE
jgi:cell volume regulation protein A